MLTDLGPIAVDVAKSWLDILAIWAAVGAGIATAASAVFIAFQAFETRKSLVYTRKALRLTRADQKRSQRTFKEAQKSRIDAEMPKLALTITSQKNQLFDGDSWAGDPRSLPLLEPGTSWGLPATPQALIGAQITVELTNDGPRRVVLALEEPGNPHSLQFNRQLTLGVGETIALRVSRVHPLSEWVRLANLYENPSVGVDGGLESNYPIFSIMYIYPGDMGAIERHTVLQGGSPITPSAPGSDAWVIGDVLFNPSHAEGHGLNAVVQPFTRTYYLSRSENKRMGD